MIFVLILLAAFFVPLVVTALTGSDTPEAVGWGVFGVVVFLFTYFVL